MFPSLLTSQRPRPIAWGHYDFATQTLSESFGISSVARVGQGVADFEFEITEVDSGYLFLSGSDDNGTFAAKTRLTTGFTVVCENHAGGKFDGSFSFIVYRGV